MAVTGSGRTYSIKEVAALVGLPPSTLRYYEEVGVIPAIARDPSSGHRLYTEGDLELLTWVACLSASGMAIADMREFVRSGLGAIGIFPNSFPFLNSRMLASRRRRRLPSSDVSSSTQKLTTSARLKVGTR